MVLRPMAGHRPKARRTGPMPVDPGLTVSEVARRYRVSEDKVRLWLRQGELKAINTSTVLSGKPRWVIPADALEAFERRRAAGAPAKHPRRRRPKVATDFFPD